MLAGLNNATSITVQQRRIEHAMGLRRLSSSGSIPKVGDIQNREVKSLVCSKVSARPYVVLPFALQLRDEDSG